ncbi:MAG: hypothetical protein HYZ53_10785 [Planctomycetes bacterium]|nr:hypothetical protein [Planctomycetota bacterium]
MDPSVTPHVMEAGYFLAMGTVAGMAVLCLGELFRVLREIAINTRKAERAEETVYPALGFVSGILHLVALVIFVGAVGAAVAAFTANYDRRRFAKDFERAWGLGLEQWKTIEQDLPKPPSAEKPAGTEKSATDPGAGVPAGQATAGGVAGGASPEGAAAK